MCTYIVHTHYTSINRGGARVFAWGGGGKKPYDSHLDHVLGIQMNENMLFTFTTGWFTNIQMSCIQFYPNAQGLICNS